MLDEHHLVRECVVIKTTYSISSQSVMTVKVKHFLKPFGQDHARQ